MENNEDIPVAYPIDYQPEVPSALVINIHDNHINNIRTPFNRKIYLRRRSNHIHREKTIYYLFIILSILTVFFIIYPYLS